MESGKAEPDVAWMFYFPFVFVMGFITLNAAVSVIGESYTKVRGGEGSVRSRGRDETIVSIHACERDWKSAGIDGSTPYTLPCLSGQTRVGSE